MNFKNKTFKFFITPVYPYGNDHYYHEMIALAEGLMELGCKVISNVDYWWQPEKNEFLLKGNLEGDFDIGIYCRRYVLSFEHLLFRKGYPNFDLNKIHVINDRNDWISPIWHNKQQYKIFDLILAGSLVEGLPVPSNVKPWAIGLTNRTIQLTDRYYNEQEELQPHIGHNYRVSHNLRKFALDQLKNEKLKFSITEAFTDDRSGLEDTVDNFYYKTTTKRQHPDFFKLLNQHLMFMAFCGYMEYKPKMYQPYTLMQKILRKPYYFLNKLTGNTQSTQFVFQHDSFRFWETMYSRTCPITLDYSSSGFILPEMPIEGEHYLGVKKFDFKDFAERLNNLTVEEILRIGANGREWVLQHYSPKAQALRLLNYLSVV